MLSEKQFLILRELKTNPDITQRELAAKVGLAASSVNDNLKKLRSQGLIQAGSITDSGKAELENYRVDNAIIMAAGMSARFAPISYEKPKGLVKVKGEILIERQIRQLQEAGIDKIIIVIGYMKEKFFYLEEKFGVELMVNPDYYRYNNTSTLWLVKDKLKNTYICSSDNYFVDNVFESYVYASYYSCVYHEGKTDEYCVTVDCKNLINKVTIGGENSLIMLGHAYFDSSFSNVFKNLLETEYEKSEVKNNLWENLYIKNLNKFNMMVREYSPNEVFEFDSIDDLQKFDDGFLNNVDSIVINNITNVLHCSRKDISEFMPIKNGMTNTSFIFKVFGERFVYRHPGKGTEDIINRESEYFSQKQAYTMGLDKTLIFMDSISGWKISRYLENNREFDYHNMNDVRKILNLIRRLHTANIQSKWEFSMFAESEKIVHLIERKSAVEMIGFSELRKGIEKLYLLAEHDHIDKCLCHVDCYAPNFLTDGNVIYLIDWEYSGNSDPAGDIGTMICCSDYSTEEVDMVLEMYFGRELKPLENRHWKAYVAISAYYWFVWALYKESIGCHVGEFLYRWYRYAQKYMAIAVPLYKEKN